MAIAELFATKFDLLDKFTFEHFFFHIHEIFVLCTMKPYDSLQYSEEFGQ